jgi:hypothetical protein
VCLTRHDADPFLVVAVDGDFAGDGLRFICAESPRPRYRSLFDVHADAEYKSAIAASDAVLAITVRASLGSTWKGLSMTHAPVGRL